MVLQMIELIALICLASSPNVCRDEAITASANVTPFQCLMGAQIELAKWANEHPGWRVMGWKCQRAGMMART